MSEHGAKSIGNPGGPLYVWQDAAGNIHVHVGGKCYTNDELGAEIERLRAERDECRELYKEDNIDASPEIEALRAALEAIATETEGEQLQPTDAARIARRALNGDPEE